MLNLIDLIHLRFTEGNIMFYLIIAILLCSIPSCDQSNANDITFSLHSVDITNSFNNHKGGRLSEICDSVYYIPLQTNDDCIIGRIPNANNNIKFSNGRIFISDEKYILMFSLDGTFINKIGSNGRGPGEYIAARSYSILEKDSIVVVLDDFRKKLLFYTFDNEFLYSVPSGLWPRYLSTLNDTLLGLINTRGVRNYSDYFCFRIVNKKGDQIGRTLNLQWEKNYEKQGRFMMFTAASIYEYKDTLSYWEHSSDTIWRICSNQKCIPRFSLIYGDDKIPFELLTESNMEEFASLDRNYIEISSILETGRYLFISSNFKGSRRRILYDKQSHQSYSLMYFIEPNKSYFKFINDLDGGPNFWPMGRVNDSVVFTIFHPLEFKNKGSRHYEILKYQLKQDSSSFQRIINNSNIMDNPVLEMVILNDIQPDER